MYNVRAPTNFNFSTITTQTYFFNNVLYNILSYVILKIFVIVICWWYIAFFKVDRKKVNCDDVNSSLSWIQDWFKTNSLILDNKKIKFVVSALPTVKYPKYNLEINNGTISVSDTTVFRDTFRFKTSVKFAFVTLEMVKSAPRHSQLEKFDNWPTLLLRV